MPSQKDGIVSPAMAPTRMATSAALPRDCAIRTAEGHRQHRADEEREDREFESRPEMHQNFADDRTAGPQRRAEIAAQRPPAQAQVLLDDGLVEADAAAHLRDALGRHLGVGAEHDRHRIAGDEADHQEDDDRDAEEDEDEIGEAGERGRAIHADQRMASAEPALHAANASSRRGLSDWRSVDASRSVTSERFGIMS